MQSYFVYCIVKFVQIRRQFHYLLFASIIYSKNFILFLKIWHCCSLILDHKYFNLCNTCCMFSECCRLVYFFMSMSSKYAPANSKPANLVSINQWKMIAATLTPNGSLLKPYRPLHLLMVNNFLHVSSTLFCRYAPDSSI